LLYKGSDEQSKAVTKVPFSFFYIQENVQNPKCDRLEQGWSPNGIIILNDNQFALLECKCSVNEELKSHHSKMELS
jgi:hypothetical protein